MDDRKRKLQHAEESRLSSGALPWSRLALGRARELNCPGQGPLSYRQPASAGRLTHALRRLYESIQSAMNKTRHREIDPRFLPHCTHHLYPSEFGDRDPRLSLLSRLPFVHRFGLHDALPTARRSGHIGLPPLPALVPRCRAPDGTARSGRLRRRDGRSAGDAGES